MDHRLVTINRKKTPIWLRGAILRTPETTPNMLPGEWFTDAPHIWGVFQIFESVSSTFESYHGQGEEILTSLFAVYVPVNGETRTYIERYRPSDGTRYVIGISMFKEDLQTISEMLENEFLHVNDSRMQSMDSRLTYTYQNGAGDAERAHLWAINEGEVLLAGELYRFTKGSMREFGKSSILVKSKQNDWLYEVPGEKVLEMLDEYSAESPVRVMLEYEMIGRHMGVQVLNAMLSAAIRNVKKMKPIHVTKGPTLQPCEHFFRKPANEGLLLSFDLEIGKSKLVIFQNKAETLFPRPLLDIRSFHVDFIPGCVGNEDGFLGLYCYCDGNAGSNGPYEFVLAPGEEKLLREKLLEYAHHEGILNEHQVSTA